MKNHFCLHSFCSRRCPTGFKFPIMFCLFVTDLMDVVKFFTIHMYADDVQLQIYVNILYPLLEFHIVCHINLVFVLNCDAYSSGIFSLTRTGYHHKSALSIRIDYEIIEMSGSTLNLSVNYRFWFFMKFLSMYCII